MSLAIVIMVKNEEDTIVPTLKPFIEAGIKNIYIYDTGSTDKTVINAEKYMKQKKCRGVVIRDDFIDFATSRNKALDQAGTYFKDVTFMLMIDAEWYINNPQGLLDFCKQHEKDNGIVYNISVKCGSIFSHARLFRTKASAFFIGRVHECVEGASLLAVPQSTYLQYAPNTGGNARSKQRWYRDLSLLLREYDEGKETVKTDKKILPYVWDKNKGTRVNMMLKRYHERTELLDPRTVFYLGQTYDCLNIKDQAIKYYLERSEMAGFVEEPFMALYRVGILYQETSWDKAFKYYMLAYEKRPTRIEPLVKIAQHYLEPHIKYMFAKMACSIPYTTDGLFVENYLYDYERWNQLGIGAWYMKFYEEGYEAVKKALKINPNQTHLITNYNLYKAMLGLNSKPKIINLILYSLDESNNDCEEVTKDGKINCTNKFAEMKDILIEHNKHHNIDHYFYCYKKDMDEDHMITDNMIYIKGNESFIPGILDKTLKALEVIYNKEYDYIIRSNISTVINYDELYKYLEAGKIDYGGPLYYISNYIDLDAGMTEEKNKKYKNCHFVSGCCVVFSKIAIKILIDNQGLINSYGLIDDVAIGIYLHLNHADNVRRQKIGNDSYSFNNKVFKPDVIMYRNKSDDRSKDVVNMKMITESLKSS